MSSLFLLLLYVPYFHVVEAMSQPYPIMVGFDYSFLTSANEVTHVLDASAVSRFIISTTSCTMVKVKASATKDDVVSSDFSANVVIAVEMSPSAVELKTILPSEESLYRADYPFGSLFDCFAENMNLWVILGSDGGLSMGVGRDYVSGVISTQKLATFSFLYFGFHGTITGSSTPWLLEGTYRSGVTEEKTTTEGETTATSYGDTTSITSEGTYTSSVTEEATTTEGETTATSYGDTTSITSEGTYTSSVTEEATTTEGETTATSYGDTTSITSESSILAAITSDTTGLTAHTTAADVATTAYPDSAGQGVLLWLWEKTEAGTSAYDLLASSEQVSDMQCGRECLRATTCSAFQYHPASKGCLLLKPTNGSSSFSLGLWTSPWVYKFI